MFLLLSHWISDVNLKYIVSVGLWIDNSRGLQSQGAVASSGAKNSRFLVFDENKCPEAVTAEPKWESWAAPPPARAKENEQKPEKWCDVKVRSRRPVQACVSC